MNRLAIPVVVLMLAASACGSEEETINEPGTRVTTVEEYAAAVCDLAARCPDISPTQQDIQNCRSGLLADFDANEDLPSIEQFLTYSRSRQDCVLACVEGLICDRFDVGLSAISGADATEPVVECSWVCQ